MNLRSIAYFLGLLCFPISILAFINILYSNYFNFFLSINTYVITLFASLILGTTFYFLGKNSQKRLNFVELFLFIIFAYLVISALISIPYYLSNYQISFIDSLFESFSGVTSTGFTIFDNVKYIDPTLVLWRSSSQWIGGFYFLVFLVIIFSKQEFKFRLTNLTFNSEENINNTENIKDLILKIFLLYLSSTILIFVILNISNVRLFNALNLSMSIISSGGFLSSNSLNQIILNQSQEFAFIVSLLIPIFNLFLLLNLFNKKKLISEHREDFVLLLLIIFSAIILFFVSKNPDFTQILFNVISSLGNSGLTLSPIQNDLALFYLFLTIIGGSLISNTSGIKFIRIYILLKSSTAEILRLVRPNNIINQSIFGTGKKIDDDKIRASFFIFITFFISLFVLSGLLIIDDINFESSFKLSILTLTNTVNSNLYDLDFTGFRNLLTSTKISLIIFMIIGKIEIISIFLFIKKILIKN